MATVGGDVTSNFDLWCDFISALQNDAVPHSFLSGRGRRRAPWVTPELAKAASKKRALFKRAACTLCPVTLKEAKALQYSLKSAIHDAHNDYVRSVALRVKSHRQLFWSYVSHLQSTKQSSYLLKNNTSVTSPRVLSSILECTFLLFLTLVHLSRLCKNLKNLRELSHTQESP